MLHSLLSGLADLIAPPTCAACRTPLAARHLGFCDGCRLLLERAPCAADDRHCDGYVYGGPLRDALHRLKYEGASEIAPRLAELLVEPAQVFLGKVDCVTAVPLHPRRLRERGYNQALLLARPVARLLGVPVLATLVRRVRDTSAQVGKSRRERTAQLAQAFAAGPGARGRAILVIDDVRTTGATLSELGQALTHAGARAVYTLALAGALSDDDAR